MGPQNLPEHLQSIRERLAAAAQAAGRNVDSITLLAASKDQPPERVRALAAAGVRHFGESYLQEALQKMAALRDLPLTCTAEAIIGGDRTIASISAASILAKMFRDALMTRLDGCYPGFDFAQHKGYATPAHLEALRMLPPSPVHRRSFSPVKCGAEPD